MSPRQAGAWDPLLQCLHLDNVCLGNKMQRNCKGLKIIACAVGANYGQKGTKRPKLQVPLLKSWEQKQGVGSKSRVLRMPPAHVTATLGDTPTLIPLRNKLAPLTCRVDLIFLCYSRGPSKALPGFLVWPLINFS